MLINDIKKTFLLVYYEIQSITSIFDHFSES